MPKKYTITENPPPFKKGPSTTTSFITPNINEFNNNKTIEFPSYNIITINNTPKPTILNSTTINQEITVVNQGIGRVSAQYTHSNSINNIINRRQLLNNGALNTYDDNVIPIWNTLTSKLLPQNIKEFLTVTLSIKCTTDTLGGSFEIELNDGTSLDIIENNITIQNQDFNIEFNIVATSSAVTNGLSFFITPELGMAINISEFSLLIIKG